MLFCESPSASWFNFWSLCSWMLYPILPLKVASARECHLISRPPPACSLLRPNKERRGMFARRAWEDFHNTIWLNPFHFYHCVLFERARKKCLLRYFPITMWTKNVHNIYGSPSTTLKQMILFTKLAFRSVSKPHCEINRTKVSIMSCQRKLNIDFHNLSVFPLKCRLYCYVLD